MTERPGAITFKGKPMTLLGRELRVGDAAPNFKLVATDLSDKSLSDYKGKTVILNIVPSLDTPVCDKQTRRFNEEAGRLGDDTVILTVSKDLPFAQKRWCAAAGVQNVHTLSDYKYDTFGKEYGLEIKELGLLARAVSIIDPQGKVRYVQLVKEVASEPNYDEVLQQVAAVA
jgi:thioredoxin-dependent peroxiredoxin